MKCVRAVYGSQGSDLGYFKLAYCEVPCRLLPVTSLGYQVLTKSNNRVVDNMSFGGNLNPDITCQLTVSTAQNRCHQRQCVNFLYLTSLTDEGSGTPMMTRASAFVCSPGALLRNVQHFPTCGNQSEIVGNQSEGPSTMQMTKARLKGVEKTLGRNGQIEYWTPLSNSHWRSAEFIEIKSNQN
jgi:hypothetical protein